jgi:hypothetical protein
MKDRGSVGALVDGGVRDIHWLRQLGYPVYARYRTPVQSIGRWIVVEWQKPVYMRGATVRRVVVSPGDFILADGDGAIVIPQILLDETLRRAEVFTDQETKLRLELMNGERAQPGAGARQIRACLGLQTSPWAITLAHELPGLVAPSSERGFGKNGSCRCDRAPATPPPIVSARFLSRAHAKRRLRHGLLERIR